MLHQSIAIVVEPQTSRDALRKLQEKPTPLAYAFSSRNSSDANALRFDLAGTRPKQNTPRNEGHGPYAWTKRFMLPD